MSFSSTPSSEDPPTSLAASQDGNRTSVEKEDGKLQIFLGGSCNPTTWRQTVAIPYLEMNGISYYNPQVDDWTPDVVMTERRAKQSAQVLLFVIDKQTRSTVSLVESAYIAGESKKLVLVIYPFEFDVLSISDTTKQTTSNIVETLTKTSLNAPPRGKIKSSSLLKSSSSSSTTTISSTLRHASRTLRMNNEVISLREFLELKRARIILQNLIAKQNAPIFCDIPQALHYISDCLNRDIYSMEQRAQAGISSMWPGDQNQNIKDRVTIHDIHINSTSTEQNTLKDIYLSLDDNGHPDLESILLLMLQERNLTYHYRPLKHLTSIQQTKINAPITAKDETLSLAGDETEFQESCASNSEEINEGTYTKLALEKEMLAIRRSRVLLFVITNRCRGLSIMVLASHFMALFRDNVVLCVQYLEGSCSIDGEKLTENAITDYNRGRVYLCDYAAKSKVPVFRTISEALDCCIQKCAHGSSNNKS